MRGSLILIGFIVIIIGAIPVFHVSVPYATTLLNSLSSMIPGGAGLLVFIGVILFIIGII
ncbi:MAG: hypothetical protein OH316_00680 [Candidatus Parvarchaeota archaeon]|nr:hypothetical protein [Candidatus Parvarchaeota archaeon]MCW1301638.1 hypothetical protein [Candidatus Parvarchaeota archaeon]